MHTTEELVYAAARKVVVAIDPRSGQRVWKHKLDEMFASYVTLALHGDMLMAAHKSSLYAIDARTGDRLWKTTHVRANSMPTMIVSGLHPSDATMIAQAQQQSVQRSAAAAG